MEMYSEMGFAKDKLVAGLPSHGRGYLLADPHKHNLILTSTTWARRPLAIFHPANTHMSRNSGHITKSV